MLVQSVTLSVLQCIGLSMTVTERCTEQKLMSICVLVIYKALLNNSSYLQRNIEQFLSPTKHYWTFFEWLCALGTFGSFL